MAMIKTADFDFRIPSAQIAAHPRPHAQHRLLAYDRQSQTNTSGAFASLGDVLPPRSLIVINNSQVVRAALKKQPDDGDSLQVLNPTQTRLDQVLAVPPEGSRAGMEMRVMGGVYRAQEVGKGVMLGAILPDDAGIDTLPQFLAQYGHIPIPSYVESDRLAADLDPAAYQTCYARVPGSLACPTAGLHFTPDLMAALEAAGHQFVEITLHIGYGSWGTLQTAYVDDFDLNAEEIIVEPDALQALWQARREGRKIVAVGTTCVRTLESIAAEVLQDAPPQAGVHRTTSLFIHPPYQPRVAGALLTDFAYPQTPVMLMSAAFCGVPALRAVYQQALQQGYMFDIFGDALLIL